MDVIIQLFRTPEIMVVPTLFLVSRLCAACIRKFEFHILPNAMLDAVVQVGVCTTYILYIESSILSMSICIIARTCLGYPLVYLFFGQRIRTIHV